MMAKKYEINMLEGSYIKKLAIFAFPLMVSSVLQLLFNAADIMVVGHFAGDQSLAAVSSTSSLVNLCVNLFIGLSTGTNIIAARLIGEGKKDDIDRIVHTSIAMGAIYGLAMTIFGFFMSRQMLIWMGSPADVRNLATLYLKIYFFGMPANLVYNFGAALLRSKGDTQRPLYFLSFAGLCNLLLNIVMVVLFKMDVAGVALATIASQYISAVLVVKCLAKEEGFLHFDLSSCRIDFKTMMEILKVGVPCGLQGTVFAISNVVIQSTINSFGSTIMAGSGAAANVEGFIFTACNSFSQAGQTFIGQNLGAKRLSNIRKVALTTSVYVFTIGFIMSMAIYNFGPLFLGFYTSSAEVVEAGMIRMGVVGKYCYIDTMMTCFSYILRGLGYVTLPMVNTLVMVCGFRLAWIATIFKTNPTIKMLYICYPLSWIIVTIVHLLTIAVVWKKIKVHCLAN